MHPYTAAGNSAMSSGSNTAASIPLLAIKHASIPAPLILGGKSSTVDDADVVLDLSSGDARVTSLSDGEDWRRNMLSPHVMLVNLTLKTRRSSRT